MLTQTQADAQELLTQFNAKKHDQEDEKAIEAQRLVNMYRNLSVFPPEFVEKYNDILLGSSKEAQVLLPSIQGGASVREYLSYLQTAKGVDTSEEKTDDSDIAIQGYLPTPEEDIVPVVSDKTPAVAGDYSKLENILESFAKAQQEQNSILEQTLTQLRESGQPTDSKEQYKEQYNEQITQFLEVQQEQFQNFARMVQELLQSQTMFLNKTLTQLSSAIQVMGQRPAVTINEMQQLPVSEQHIATSPVSETTQPSQNIYDKNNDNTMPEHTDFMNAYTTARVSAMPKKKTKHKPLIIDDDMEILTEVDLPQED